ncbi:helix-turn-helix domain-containing protein [Thalassospira marina]|uniref:Transcriptional regulator n=1 Tax=Thalassospira marina TaxID=2048283 RepID=A0ABN5FME6_9PROT|nr:helix-turn-helix transcriptional regulator [Thalassospira marina]AUG55906.1 transcriptional regulator [Thalassospira marina]
MSHWQAEYLALHTRLRQIRRQKGLTQTDAGQCIGVSERTYRDFEAGRIDLSAAHLFRLAHALGFQIVISNGVNANGAH